MSRCQKRGISDEAFTKDGVMNIDSSPEDSRKFGGALSTRHSFHLSLPILNPTAGANESINRMPSPRRN